MQIKHVKVERKPLPFLFIYFSIEIDTVLAKLLTLMNNMNLSHSADSVVFYQVKLIQHAQLQGLIKIVQFHLSLV